MRLSTVGYTCSHWIPFARRWDAEHAAGMRQFQVFLFGAGVLAFLGSACFIGSNMGDTLWRTGVAVMLGDLVCMRLWPPRHPL